MLSARARAPQANRAAVPARYRQADGAKPSDSVAKRARVADDDDVLAKEKENDADADALEKQNPRPTLRYVVPSRAQPREENAEKENGAPPKTSPAKRPAAKRRKPPAPRDDPKQVTLSQAFAGPGAGAGAASRGTTARASESVSTPESIDDVELAPVTGTAETRPKKKKTHAAAAAAAAAADVETPRQRRDDSKDSFVLSGGDTNFSSTLFLETFARAIRSASACSIGVLFRDVVGSRRFGFRSNASPEPDAARKEAARKAARAAGGGAPPPEGGWQAAVTRVPVAVGVLPLGAGVADAGDGLGGALFAFPVVETASAAAIHSEHLVSYSNGPALEKTKTFSLHDEHRDALLSLLRAGVPLVAFHAQSVFKALGDLGVRPLIPVLARVTVLDARAMAWLHAPDSTHEGGVDEARRKRFSENDAVIDPSRRKDTSTTEAFVKFRRDLASSAALVQAFRRASSHDARLRADADLLARFARTTLRECRVAALLGVMEHAGIGFDVSYARRLVSRLRKEVESIEREADAAAVTNADGSRLNLAAPAQVAEALFVTLRLQKPPAVKAGRNDGLTHSSTRDEVLRALACDKNAHPLVGLVLRHRAASRAAATCASYVSMYEKENGARDGDDSFGRLRCEWNNTRTATGRLSSSNPNLQAVGGGVESHREAAREAPEEAFLSLRGAFVAPSGRVLLAADYSQIELRVLAHLARDPKLLEILAPPPKRDEERGSSERANDAFERIWNEGRGVAASAPVTPADRAKAKTTVYGLLYGQGEAGLAHKLGVSREEAGDITRALYAAFPSLRRFVRETREEARRARGAFLPLAARLRPLPGFGSADASARAEAERRAVNTLVQGTAADLMKLAMERWCRVVSAEEKSTPSSGKKSEPFLAAPPGFDASRASLVAQIHDELMFEVDDDVACVEATAECVRRCMEGAAEELGLVGLWTPTKVTVGKNWGALVSIDAFVAEKYR